MRTCEHIVTRCWSIMHFMFLQPHPPITTAAAVWDYECTSAAPRVSLSLCVCGTRNAMLGPVCRAYLHPSGCSTHLAGIRLPMNPHTHTHTGCIQMHTRSKYSLKQAELLILLLSFPCSIFTHSTDRPPPCSFSFLLFFCLSSSFPSCSLSTAAERSSSSFEGPHPRLHPLLSLSSSVTPPPSLPVRIHLLLCAVSGWLCICSVNLSHSLPCLPSISRPSLTHTCTQTLIPGLSGPFNFHRPVVLTSPPIHSFALLPFSHTASLQFDLPPFTFPLLPLSLFLSLRAAGDVLACQSGDFFLTPTPLPCRSLTCSPQDAKLDVIKILWAGVMV